MSYRGRRIFWLVATVAGALAFAWGAVDGVRRARQTPDAPVDRTLAELQSGPVPSWVRLTDGLPRCDRVQRANNHDVVPVQPAADSPDASSRLLLIALENDELCASLTPPLLVAPMRRSTYAQRVLEESHVGRLPLVANDVFGLEPDAVGEATENVVIPTGLMLACIGALVWQVLRWRRLPSIALGAVGDVAAAPVGGAFDAIARGSTAAPGESLLPPAPLLVSAAAQRHAWRAKYVGPAILVAAAVGLGGLSAWGTVGVVNDLRAWYGGVEVPAELKGSTTSKLIVTMLDIQLAWQMPDEPQVRSTERLFMTLWMADDDGGRVRALVSNPDVVTFEEAVDLVPFRVPLLLAGFGIAIGSLLSARTTRRNAERIHRIAATAVEGVLVAPTFVETRVNGATTGWTVSGVLDGKGVSASVGAVPGPNGLVLADGSGALVVVKSADGEAFTPLFVDGEPFAWTASSWAHAQAVLQARGSPTRLVG